MKKKGKKLADVLGSWAPLTSGPQQPICLPAWACSRLTELLEFQKVNTHFSIYESVVVMVYILTVAEPGKYYRWRDFQQDTKSNEKTHKFTLHQRIHTLQSHKLQAKFYNVTSNLKSKFIGLASCNNALRNFRLSRALCQVYSSIFYGSKSLLNL